MQQPGIESVSKEARSFAPPREFSEAAHISSKEQYAELYRRSLAEPEDFLRSLHPA